MLSRIDQACFLSAIGGSRPFTTDRGASWLGEELPPWPERREAARLPARRPGHPRVRVPRDGGQLFTQPGLADAALTRDDHGPAGAVRSLIDIRAELLQLALPPNKASRRPGVHGSSVAHGAQPPPERRAGCHVGMRDPKAAR
jgi:hypothetical protein